MMHIPGSFTAILAILLGGLVCFLGYKVLRVALAIAGFVVGAAFFGGAVALLPNATQLWVLIAAGVGGVLGAVLAGVVYKVGVFLLGVASGVLAASLVVTALGLVAVWWVLAIAGLIGGILALLLQKKVVSILTAFVGAWAVVAGTFELLGWYDIEAVAQGARALRKTGPYFWLMLVMWLGLGLLGALVQLAAGRRKRKG